MKTFSSGKRGLIDTIVLIVVALVVLGYFQIDVRGIFTSPVVKDNLKYAWELVVWAFSQLREYGLPTLKEIVDAIRDLA